MQLSPITIESTSIISQSEPESNTTKLQQSIKTLGNGLKELRERKDNKVFDAAYAKDKLKAKNRYDEYKVILRDDGNGVNRVLRVHRYQKDKFKSHRFDAAWSSIVNRYKSEVIGHGNVVKLFG